MSTCRSRLADADHFKVFATEEAANAWFAANDPEGVAFEYEVRTSLRARGSRPVSARGWSISRQPSERIISRPALNHRRSSKAGISL